MSDNASELNGTATDVDPDPPTNVAPENTSDAAPEEKKGPPVAPKPTWFRQSLRKIRDEQDQKKQAKPADTRPTVGFNRSFGARPASSAANLSIKQKIHSFETFSSPLGPEKGSNRGPVSPSTSLPLVERQSRSHPASHGDYGKGNEDIPKEIEVKQSASVNETDNTTVSTITSSSSEACSQTSKPSEEEPPPIQSPKDLPLSDTVSTGPDSGVNYSGTDRAHDDRDALSSKQEYELDLSRSTESNNEPPVTCLRSSQSEEQSPSEGTEEDGALTPTKLLNTTLNTGPPADSPPSRGLEEESFGKIITFSNQVSQALMRSLPAHPCNSNPSSPTFAPDCKESEAQDSSDTGFSVSLATLRECTIERGEGGCHDEAAVTSACAHSVISAIPSQEIERMVQEVKALDEETLKQLMDIHVVILHKEEGAGLGFSIAGGSDLESKALTVHKMFPSGLAAREGTIEKGDEVLSVNGQTLRGVTHADAVAVLRQARSPKLAVVVISKKGEEEGREEGGCRSKEPNTAVEEQGAPMSVELEKGAGGVGFTLEGGKGSIHGDRPLVINRIFQGGTAEQNNLQPGDEVLQVQGVSLQDMTRFEAWNMIKALPEGPITVVIRRKQESLE